MNPITLVKTRLAQWWQERSPLTDRVTLTQHNVYILPTRAGLMLGVTLLVLLIASINYQLNLGYLLTFLLAGCALVSMHISHGTLRGMAMVLLTPEPVFMGCKANISINLHNTRKHSRRAIALAVMNSGQWVCCDVPAQGSALVHLAWQPNERGLHRVPTLSVQTFFPLGTFRVWTLWRPAAQILVYPQPETGAPPLPSGQLDAGHSQTNTRHHQGEPDGLRPYRRGDALKNIVWKKAAKTGELVSRDSISLQHRELWLERQQTGLKHPEQQLSRLCAWVLHADQSELRYGLKLGAETIAPDHGPAHLQRCLRALALA